MNSLSPITRNLLIANVVCYLLQLLAGSLHIDLTDLFGLHFVLADDFRVWQLVSYMFLHGSLTHLFFNMFSLWMFGGLIERTLGAKRFLTYWMVCGIGAGICQEFWQTGQYFVEGLNNYPMVNTGSAIISMGDYLNLWTTIGASGACYGVLLAFGMLFPNERIMLLLPPIPMKAKYFVAGYAAIELISAYVSNDNVAHFAHLGGMLFGWLLLRYWRTSRSRRPAANGWTRWNEPPRTPSLWERITSRLRNRRTEQPGNAHHTATRQNDYDYNIRRRQEEQRMDELLDKIRQSGYDSLTQEEKQELFRISRR
ncbi:MAG: rhomboid family intramembrane serine protease [Bacteroidales bacterium]|nr:rhomboid family intramembrane serine protease [Bacteroidales bacterium]